MRFAAGKRAAFAIEREITESDLDEKLQTRLNFPNDFGHDCSLLRGQIEIVDVARGRFDRLLAELMNVQLARLPIFDRDRENLRLEPRAAAGLARHARHERADAIAREFAFRFLVEPLHLRDEPFERLCDSLFSIATEIHLDGLAVRAEIERIFEFVR